MSDTAQQNGSIRLRNNWKFVGNRRWEWSAFLDDEGTGELSDVDYVEYVLHGTFPQPLVRVDNPQDGFALQTSGWGIFTLVAFVHKKDGTQQRLTHELELASEPAEGVSA